SSENIQSENNTSDANIDVTTESALIQQEYAMDYIDNFVGKVEIYLTITIEQTFIIKIDFSEFPKRPIIELPEGLSSLFGDINSALDVLRKWNEKKPSHVVEIIRELEGKLWFLSDIDGESKRIAGEYKTELIGGIISNLKVTLLTYGFKEYQVEIDISKYPDPPTIIYSSELDDLIKSPVENLNSFKKWKRKESHAVELLEEISWLVDKNSRINFELALMKGGMKDVSYNESLNIISAVLKGEMKTKDLTFKFEVKLSNDYPVSAPIIKLKSELESMEDIKEKLTTQINTFTSSWHQFNYLIDLFNQISKAIFEVSVISCVICHQIECLACKKKISAPDTNDQCQVICPHCERLYHKCCWDQTILSFKKCGFCLRPPPPNMMPNI
ncbi:MAG: hypothetical protein GY870_14345, partial [archaeon]|nr:hypothetical protein [archaeon]